MILIEILQYLVIDCLDRGGDKQHARALEFGKLILMLQQVLYLDGSVESDGGKLRMQGARNAQCVGRPIQEIRIAKGNMLRPLIDLLADIFHYDVKRHRTKSSLINRHYRTVAA